MVIIFAYFLIAHKNVRKVRTKIAHAPRLCQDAATGLEVDPDVRDLVGPALGDDVVQAHGRVCDHPGGAPFAGGGGG